MPDPLATLQDHLGFFLLVFTRISGIFTAAPVFGSRNIPVMAKVGLGLSVSALIMPVVFSAKVNIPSNLLQYIAAVISEYLLGLVYGFASWLIFSAVQMAGALLDTQIGFGIVNVVDPQYGQQIPLIGNFQYLLSLVLFLAINGHHVLLAGICTSFKTLPVASVFFPQSIVPFFVNLLTGVFSVAVQIAMPVLAALFMTDVALGILARVMPQLNIFVVGLPVKIVVGLVILMFAVPVFSYFMEVGFHAMFKELVRLLALFQ